MQLSHYRLKTISAYQNIIKQVFSNKLNPEISTALQYTYLKMAMTKVKE